MMLHFEGLMNLKTKRMHSERNCATLEFLRELSAKRRPIEESINHTSSITEAIERERSGGLTFTHEQDLHKLEQYLPLLEDFIHCTDSFTNKTRLNEWISQLKIQWTSALNSSCFLKPRSTTFYQINSLKFELAMCLFLYAGILHDHALELLLSDDLVMSATLLRKAAGIYDYLSSLVLPLLSPLLSSEKPMETTHQISSVLGLVCLAEAQAVAIKKAETKGSSAGVLAKLHFGAVEFLEEAIIALLLGCGDLKRVSLRFVDFIYSSKALHELRGYRHLAESYRQAGQYGIAIGLLRLGLNKAQKEWPEEQAWKLIFKMETSQVCELQNKYEYENNFLSREKEPLEHELLPPESKKIVSYTPYQPQASSMVSVRVRHLCFNV